MIYWFIDEGERLLQALRNDNFPVTTALWRYFDYDDLWRLFIVTPKVDEEGSLRTYSLIAKSIENLQPPLRMSISAISAMGEHPPNAWEIKRMVREALRTPLCFSLIQRSTSIRLRKKTGSLIRWTNETTKQLEGL